MNLLPPRSLGRALFAPLLAIGLLGLTACGDDDPASIITGETSVYGAIEADADTDTLQAAIDAAGLAQDLSDGSVTLFAAFNDAFGGIDTRALLADTDRLAQILRYHVLNSAVTTEGLTVGEELSTLAELPLFVREENAEVTINGAPINRANLDQTNGVIHVIGRLLIPEVVQQVALSTSTTTLETALDAAGLTETVENATPTDPLTVLAPTDDALGALGGDNVDFLVANPDLLDKVLRYHIIPGRVRSPEVAAAVGEGGADGFTTATLEGSDVTFAFTRDADSTITNLEVNGRAITTATVDASGAVTAIGDLETADGVVHLIDGVLLENLDLDERVLVSPQTDVLADALTSANIDLSTGGPYTVFAPADGAFDDLGEDNVAQLLADPSLLSEVLRYHVVQGATPASEIEDGETAQTVEGATLTFSVSEDGAVSVNGVPVTTADVTTADGSVIHLIDGLLFESLTVTERVAFSAQTDSLEAAVVAAGLDDDLATAGPFTVFAPVDDAEGIAALVDLVEAGDADVLANILRYHVVPGEITADEITDRMRATTLQGQDLVFRLGEDEEGNPTVEIVSTSGDVATVTQANLQVSNGVIHLIDTVLGPAPEGDGS